MTALKTGKLPKLPIGVQTFRLIREDGALYVDKTGYLAELASGRKRIFLSRPRRFGKSLTISTLDAMFSGKADLFKGLAAEEWVKEQAKNPNKVLRFDLVSTVSEPSKLELDLDDYVAGYARNYGIELFSRTLNGKFRELIEAVYQKHGPVVVLIDEYDRPILDSIDDAEKAEKVREILRSFYSVLKGCDEDLRFVMLTGISKFSKAGVFSSMNNLKDISMDESYGTIVGYTQEELEFCFADWIDETAEKLNIGREDLLAKVKSYYDGFSFDGKTKVYNPFSVLNFFDTAEFGNYWYDTGSPSFLSKYFKTHRSDSLESYSSKRVSSDFLTAKEIEAASPESFLYQAGYLTIKSRDEQFIYLDYPNKEVITALSRLFLDTVYRLPDSANTRWDALTALKDGDMETLIRVYNLALAPIPYGDFTRHDEAFYRAIFTAVLRSAGITCVAEAQSSKGRSDMAAIMPDRAAVFEFKLGKEEKEFDRLLEEAKNQIIEKEYAAPYENSGKTVNAVAIVINGKKHEVARWEQIK